MAIQMRRGEKKDFDPAKLKVGEFAVPTDTGELYIKTSETVTKGIATLNSSGKLEQMPSYSDVGAAPTNHNHSTTDITSGTLPVARGGTGATTAASAITNLGAVPKNRTINSKTLSSNISLTATDVGAVAIDFNRISISSNADLNSYTTLGNYCCGVDSVAGTIKNSPIERAFNLNVIMPLGTNSSFLAQELLQYNTGTRYYRLKGTGSWGAWQKNYDTSNLTYATIDAVPASRTVNNKALSANISLSASDVGAATAAQGTKADSAIQGVKVNGVLLAPDAGKVVDVNAQSIDSAPVNHASTATTYGVSSAANYGHAMASSTSPKAAGTATVGTEASKFARGDHVHPAQTSITGNAATATKLATARTIGISGGATGTATSFNGSANIKIPVTAINPSYLSAAVAIAKGGTGATTASSALTNLGIPYENGTWTPIPGAGANQCYYTGAIKGGYVRIGRLVYVYAESSDLVITNAASGDAVIKGLPFTISGSK